MTSNTFVLTDEARRFALEAIHGFAKLLEPGDITLLPEIFIQNVRGEIKVVVVSGGDEEGGTAEENLATARELLEKFRNRPDVVRNAALAYDSYLTSGRKKITAITIELLGPGVTYTLAQQYVIGRDGKAELIGGPLYLAVTQWEASPS